MGPAKRLSILKEIRQTATMENAGFGHPPSGRDLKCEGDLPKSEEEVNDFIKRRTRLWRGTWILAYLDRLIKADKEALEKQRNRKPTVPNIFD